MTRFELIEVKSTSENTSDYYIEGYISTIDPDFINDIVDDTGQKSVYNELQNSDITMDEDHDEWRDPATGKLYDGKKNKYPIAKIESSKLDNIGTWVRAKLNKYHPDFETRILPMIKDGYLHSFSIAYNVNKSFSKLIDGIKYRVIQGLKIANVAITGNPVNKKATFNIALKSYSKMVEEKNYEELETQNQELKSQVDTLTSQVNELKSEDYKGMYTKLKADYDKLKGDYDKMMDKKEDTTEVKSMQEEIVEVKSMIDKLEKENAELKSMLEAPQLKSIIEAKSVEPSTADEKPQRLNVWSVV